MRILMNVKFPHQQFNAAVREGTADSKLGAILDALKPEVAYFTEQGGQRSVIIVVDLADATKIPSLAEPWFLTFDADVEFHPVMTPEDLKNGGLGELAKRWA